MKWRQCKTSYGVKPKRRSHLDEPLMSSPYQPLATSEDDHQPPGRKQRLSRLTLFLLAFTCCLLALGFYKAGQWSVLRQQVQVADITTEPKGNNTEQGTDNMSELNEKYSVG
jgi:hypothetical protein